MSSTIRDEDTAVLYGAIHVPQVGQFYYDVAKAKLYCLNDTARRLRGENMPLMPDHPSIAELRKEDGSAVRGEELPLAQALRDGQPAEGSFLLVRSQLERRLHCSASPLKDGEGRIAAVVNSVVCMPPAPHWAALAGLAHDLRTPLQAITLALQILEFRTISDAERSEALHRLTSASDRAMQIAKELLEWARARGNKSSGPQLEWAPLEPLLLAVLAEQQPAAQQKGLALNGSCAIIRGWQIHTDRGRLARVLANLLVNAVRYTPAGGRVRLDASWEQQNGLRVLALEVHDTGAGILPHEQESIFQPFERGQAGRDSDSPGSGVGLAVVQHLTYELGLDCEVHSAAGQGSHFRVFVPVDKLRPST